MAINYSVLGDKLEKLAIVSMEKYTIFAVKIRAAKTLWPDSFERVDKLNGRIIEYWHNKGFDDARIEGYNLIPQSWDILQKDFCYDYRTQDESSFITNRNINFWLSKLIDNFQYDLYDIRLPISNQIRYADVIQDVDLETKIKGMASYLNKVSKLKRNKDVGEVITDNMFSLTSDEFAATEHEPIFLKPGTRYGFTQRGDTHGLYLSVDFDAGYDDIIDAIEDFKMQYHSARKHFHKGKDNDEVLFRLMDNISESRNSVKMKDNKYITQSNSIFNTLAALYSWDLIHNHKLKNSDAHHRSVAIYDGLDFCQIDYKKVKDRYDKKIEPEIGAQISRYRAGFRLGNEDEPTLC